MIVVRADIWKHGEPPEPEDCVVDLLIANDATGTPERGNYKVWEIDGHDDPHDAYRREDNPFRQKEPLIVIKGFPRRGNQRHVASLIGLVLDLYARGETQASCWDMDG